MRDVAGYLPTLNSKLGEIMPKFLNYGEAWSPIQIPKYRRHPRFSLQYESFCCFQNLRIIRNMFSGAQIKYQKIGRIEGITVLAGCVVDFFMGVLRLLD